MCGGGGFAARVLHESHHKDHAQITTRTASAVCITKHITRAALWANIAEATNAQQPQLLCSDNTHHKHTTDDEDYAYDMTCDPTPKSDISYRVIVVRRDTDKGRVDKSGQDFPRVEEGRCQDGIGLGTVSEAQHK